MGKASAALLALALVSLSAQWDKKQPANWTRSDVEKLLSDSPWAKTQTRVTTIERDMPRRPGEPDRTFEVRGEIRIRIWLLSAKPVREALGRYVTQLSDERARDEIRDLLESFEAEDQSQYISVMVSCVLEEANRQLDEVRDALHTRALEDFKPDTFVDVDGKQKIELVDYRSWGRLSGLFKFPRTIDGEELVKNKSAEFRFHTKLSSLSIDARFKPAEMMYRGALEY